MKLIELTERQDRIVEIVRNSGPITGEQIADKLNLTRATLRPDLAILTMAGILEARPRVGYFYSGKSSWTMVAEQICRLKVKDIKSVPVVVQEKASVYDAAVTMFMEDVGTLIVVGENGILEGIISRKDLLKVALGQTEIHRLPVSVIMTRMPNVVTVTPEDTLLVAARKIIEHEVDGLPVVRLLPGDDGREQMEVVGRVTKTNITKLFMELGEGK